MSRPGSFPKTAPDRPRRACVMRRSRSSLGTGASRNDDTELVLRGVITGTGCVAEEHGRYARADEVDVVAAVLSEDRAQGMQTERSRASGACDDRLQLRTARLGSDREGIGIQARQYVRALDVVVHVDD